MILSDKILDKEEVLYTKSEIINSKKFADKRDILNAVLKNDEKVSLALAYQKIIEFEKREI